MKQPSPRHPWLRPLVAGFILFVLAMIVISFFLLARWTNVTETQEAEAQRVFATTISEAGGGPPYIEIKDDGSVVIHREQEDSEPEDFDTLSMLAWSPGNTKMIRADYPRWFVRLKTASFLNLGTMISATRQDWGHLDLSISYEDLKKRGPALLLDLQLENGARMVLWTSGKNQPPIKPTEPTPAASR